MVLWMALEQTQAVDLLPIHAHAALHSGSKPEPKPGQIAGSPTFDWCNQDSRIRDVNRNLVFEDVPLEFGNLRTRRVRDRGGVGFVGVLLHHHLLRRTP